MKRFALIVKYITGKCVYLTDKPDVVSATQEFQDNMIKIYGNDKSSMMPTIQSVELIPIYYEKQL